MFNKILFFLVVSVPIFSASGETDIFPRVFNFVIFAYILYILVFEKLSTFLKDRSQGIDDKMKESEQRLKSLKIEEENSKKEIKKAESLAKDIIEDAKKTSLLVQEQIQTSASEKLIHIKDSYEQRAEIENKKAIHSIVEKTLSDKIFTNSIDNLSQDIIVDLINKKVA